MAALQVSKKPLKLPVGGRIGDLGLCVKWERRTPRTSDYRSEPKVHVNDARATITN